MIDFLKESTFAVNDVINKAWHILKEQYFLIAGMCFLMFLTLNLSSVLPEYVQSENPVIQLLLRLLFLVVFVIIYFGLQLALFNFSLRLIDSDNQLTDEFFKIRVYNYLKILAMLIGVALLCSAILGTLIFALVYFGYDINISILNIFSLGCLLSLIWLRKSVYPLVVMIKINWPQKRQMLNFLVATVCSILLLFIAMAVVGTLFFPVYAGIPVHMRDAVVEIAVSLGIVLSTVVVIRISFFPLFIMDRDCSAFKSLRFSLAITRGNFIRLTLLLCFLAIFHMLSWYFTARELGFLVIIVNTVNSFFIVPLSSLVTAVAYRQMMSEYKGDEDPDVIHNLI